MAAAGKGVRIRLEPEDEYPHPVEAASNFNESVYFNVFDPERNVGGWFRLANRPNEGKGEMSCCVYLPDGRVGFMFARPDCHANDSFENGGMKVQVQEPFKRVHLHYTGKLCVLANPQDMQDPSWAFRNNPIVRADVDITFTGVSPMFGGEPVKEDGSRIEEKPEEAFARGHYEQHMEGEGMIRVADEVFRIHGFGLRDHSWGPRFWQNIHWYRWLPMNFGRDFAMMISVVTRPNGEQRRGGMVLRDGEYVMIRDARIETEYDAHDCQARLKAWAKTDEREYEVTGKVMSLIPLRNRRTSPDGEEMMTRIAEGMTQYECDGMTGYGLSEYLDQIVDGVPVGKQTGS